MVGRALVGISGDTGDCDEVCAIAGIVAAGHVKETGREQKAFPAIFVR